MSNLLEDGDPGSSESLIIPANQNIMPSIIETVGWHSCTRAVKDGKNRPFNNRFTIEWKVVNSGSNRAFR